MLHILWMVIKFILILTAVLIGLALLAVLLVLFCPVRYRLEAEKKRDDALKEVRARAGVSWLFHAVCVKVSFENGTPKIGVRILGIPLDKITGFLEKRKRSGAEQEKPESVRTQDDAGSGEDTSESPEDGAPSDSPVSDSMVLDSPVSDSPVSDSPVSDSPVSDSPVSDFPASDSKETGLFRKIVGKLKEIFASAAGIWKKIRSIPAAAAAKIRKMTLTIRSICGTIDWWKAFFTHPRTKEAISFLWQDAKKLIRHVLPTKAEGNLTIGSEDPAVTGAVLAVLGVSFPLHKNCVAVTPLFEGENILEGSIRMKGRIYGWVFIKTAIEIYFNKNIKYVISRWKHKEG